MSIPSRLRKAVILLAVIIFISTALFLGLRKTVTLTIDGHPQSVTTYAFNASNLLHSLDIPLSSLDALSPSLDSWLTNGDQVNFVHAIPIQVLADGQLRSFYSADRSPENLLANAGVSLLPGDQILSNGKLIDPSRSFPEEIRALSMQIIRQVNFSISEHGKITDLTSTAPTLGSALWSAGYRMFAADQLDPIAYTPLTQGESAHINRSRLVTIKIKDSLVTTRTAAKTVGEALQSSKLSAQGLDYSLPAADDLIPANGEIRLVRVSEDVLVEQSPIPFETEYQPDPDLEIDNQSSIQTGEYGLSASRVRVRYEDGQEVSRQVEHQWVALQPQSRIVGYGTSVVMHTAVVDGQTIQYWRALNMYATSYHPSNTGSTTASGLPLKKGVAAVDTSIIPFYTQMYVPGYGEVIAADIGGGVVGRWIDLGYSDDDYVPWHQEVTVYFLWPPPGNIVWIIR